MSDIKYLVLIAIVAGVMLCCGQVRASECNKQSDYLEIAYQVLNFVDEQQTENIARNPNTNGRYGYEEVGIARNFIGSHPSVQDVQVYFLASAIVHYYVVQGLCKYASQSWSSAYQYVTFAYEYDTIGKNVQVMGGLKIPLN